jgi:predicted adenine nucleotide alpha hydrolase (AANH) superfamily ATPase
MLIHVCCAHCLAKTLAGLRAEFGAEFSPRGYCFNPNIHPLIEFRRRAKAVQVYLERDAIPCDFDETYGLKQFCAEIHPVYDFPARCAKCYELRLEESARYAAAKGVPVFTTTMITSSHQCHELIRSAGEAAARRHGVDFLYRDLCTAQAPEKLVTGLYRQQYCGCVFSEEDRYRDTSTHLYRNATS